MRLTRADWVPTTDDDLVVDLAIEMCDHGGPTVCADCARRASRALPAVRRFADAKVAADRERIAAEQETWRDGVTEDGPNLYTDTPYGIASALIAIARREQP
jgi:hypothetical protein